MGKRGEAALAVVALAAFVGVSLALVLPINVPDASFCHFAAYPVALRFRARPQNPALGGFEIPAPYHPFIVNAAHDGPNFAGAFTVVPYELRSGAVIVLVISARTGMVYRAPGATGYTVRHRLDSNLLVYRPARTGQNDRNDRCFVFRGGRFFEINGPTSKGN